MNVLPEIQVGVLHSLSGTMAISETHLVDAVLMAIEEVNQGGGVLGRRVRAIVEDGASDPDTFAAKAEKLLAEEQVVPYPRRTEPSQWHCGEPWCVA